MGTEPAFADVEDTPMFRQRVDDLEQNVKRLRDRCTTFIQGSRKYRDGISVMHDSQLAFASSLNEFCGGSDEESQLLGGYVMAKFVNVFKELASFHDLLRTQVDVSLCERLQQTWVDGILAHVKEDHRRYDRKLAEHEAARIKYLALKKVTKKEVVERAHADLAAARKEAEEARFDMARKLNEVELRKKHAFLEAMVSNIHSHLKFFEHGYELLKRQEPFIQQALEIVEHLKQDESGRSKTLEEMMAQYQQQAATREALLLQIHSPDDHVGPVQMTSTNASLVGEVEALIRQTQHSGGERVTIIKQGYLHKKSGQMKQMRADWKRRFFVLDSQGMLYYYSHKDTGLLAGHHRREKPKNTVNLLTSTIKMEDEERQWRFCFRIVSPEGTYTLQAENELERQEWSDAIQVVINCLLNGEVAVEHMPRKPSRATHSRSSSYSDHDLQYISASPHSVTHRPNSPSGAESSDYMPLSPSSSSPPATPHANDPSSTTGLPPMRRHRSHHSRQDSKTYGLTPLERLRRVDGNRLCADCSAPEPDWASLNLGVLLCIECSGIHRKMGVHISKVRSCTLDVRVWDSTILSIFDSIGNAYSNQVWEGNLKRSLNKADSWIWCDNSDDEDTGSGSSTRRSTGAPGQRSQRELLLEEGATPYTKPTTTTPLSEKDKYIKEKYVNKTFVPPHSPEVAASLLWGGVELGDIRQVLQGLAAGADINSSYNTQAAQQLVAEANRLAHTAANIHRDDGQVVALHLGSAQGNVVLLEFLLQNNALYEKVDPCGRTPLHYAIIFDKPDAAKVLLRRGAGIHCQDVFGHTALDLAMLKGAVRDEELFLMLAGTK